MPKKSNRKRNKKKQNKSSSCKLPDCPEIQKFNVDQKTVGRAFVRLKLTIHPKTVQSSPLNLEQFSNFQIYIVILK